MSLKAKCVKLEESHEQMRASIVALESRSKALAELSGKLQTELDRVEQERRQYGARIDELRYLLDMTQREVALYRRLLLDALAARVTVNNSVSNCVEPS